MRVLARNVRVWGYRDRPLIVGLVLLAGCGTSQSWTASASWTKATVEVGEVERDASGCLLTATSSPVVNSKGIVTSPRRVSKDKFVACMQFRGYQPSAKTRSELLPRGSEGA